MELKIILPGIYTHKKRALCIKWTCILNMHAYIHIIKMVTGMFPASGMKAYNDTEVGLQKLLHRT